MRIIIGIFIYICLGLVILEAQNKQSMSEMQKIDGTVTDSFGIPWENATVKLKSKGTVYKGSKEAKIEKETKTDSNGKYNFTDLPEDSYEVTLLKINSLGTLEETKQTKVLFNGEIYRVDFGVEVGSISECRYFVIGSIKDIREKVIEEATVSIFSAFNQKQIYSTTTDKKGDYRIKLCNLGQYVIFINTPKYEVKTSTVIFNSYNDNLVRANFTLKPLSQEILNWRK